MNKLLVICGPTATGKTKLALSIAKKINGEIVSADSRQVYKDLDIGTGKDIPYGSRFYSTKLGNYYLINSVKVWGYDLVDAKYNYNVSNYLADARRIIKGIWNRKKIPILVGGSGFYIKAVIDGIGTSKIPINKQLRSILEDKDKKELYEMLAQLNPIKAASLNSSDRSNPRRLIRAIEVSQWIVKKGKKISSKTSVGADLLMVGLYLPKNILYKRIKKRVKERLSQGLLDEIEKLLKRGINWNDLSMNTLGYKQWRGFFDNSTTKENAIEKWVVDEVKYAKRQMTWFKKDKRIVWFDSSKKDFIKSVEKLIYKWHNEIALNNDNKS